MIIVMDLPLMGTWYNQTSRGDVLDPVCPVPLPVKVSYRCTLQTLHPTEAFGTYEIDIDDATLTPAKVAIINALVQAPDKRAYLRSLGHEPRPLYQVD